MNGSVTGGYSMFIIVALLIFSVDAAIILGQEVQVSTPRMHSLAEVLASHGVTDLSEESLMSTLTNSDPQVRIVAAMKLAEDHHDDAAPAVESALFREQDLNAQIGLSEALWELHNDKGIAHLHAMCTNPALKLATLNSVVDALSLTHSPAGVCAETFIAAMGSAKEPAEIAMGTTRLSVIYRDATPEQARRILTALLLFLADNKQATFIRLEASQALADIGTPECAEAIRTAISKEENPDTRLFFEATLKGLLRKSH
jgi:HEAT repeat protein